MSDQNQDAVLPGRKLGPYLPEYPFPPTYNDIKNKTTTQSELQYWKKLDIKPTQQQYVLGRARREHEENRISDLIVKIVKDREVQTSVVAINTLDLCTRKNPKFVERFGTLPWLPDEIKNTIHTYLFLFSFFQEEVKEFYTTRQDHTLEEIRKDHQPSPGYGYNNHYASTMSRYDNLHAFTMANYTRVFDAATIRNSAAQSNSSEVIPALPIITDLDQPPMFDTRGLTFSQVVCVICAKTSETLLRACHVKSRVCLTVRLRISCENAYDAEHEIEAKCDGFWIMTAVRLRGFDDHFSFRSRAADEIKDLLLRHGFRVGRVATVKKIHHCGEEVVKDVVFTFNVSCE